MRIEPQCSYVLPPNCKTTGTSRVSGKARMQAPGHVLHILCHRSGIKALAGRSRSLRRCWRSGRGLQILASVLRSRRFGRELQILASVFEKGNLAGNSRSLRRCFGEGDLAGSSRYLRRCLGERGLARSSRSLRRRLKKEI